MIPWAERLSSLCDELRERTRSHLAAHLAVGSDEHQRAHGQGAGDVTFGLDLPAEERISAWIGEQARESPLSVLTEDAGWRHMGPGPGGEPRELSGFDHGGPRIAIDPVDGTRNLMADLRSAWTVIGFAPPGRGEPRLSELTGGIVSEIPGTLAARYRRLVSLDGRCQLAVSELSSGRLVEVRELRVDADDRADHGYFPFFRYEPALRPDLARLEAAFFERLVRYEGAQARSFYDDQYISNAGQLVLLALGRYRMVVDARELVGRRRGLRTVTAKPYDLAGAVVCARAAGVELSAADGSSLDFPIDTRTAVGFAGYANARTRARLEPHWLAVLADES
jgi:fructose-1,6-bisphosphatase/inositol monophosphatase family enzyme